MLSDELMKANKETREYLIQNGINMRWDSNSLLGTTLHCWQKAMGTEWEIRVFLEKNQFRVHIEEYPRKYSGSYYTIDRDNGELVQKLGRYFEGEQMSLF